MVSSANNEFFQSAQSPSNNDSLELPMNGTNALANNASHWETKDKSNSMEVGSSLPYVGDIAVRREPEGKDYESLKDENDYISDKNSLSK